MKERIHKILTEKGLSAAKFAEILEIQRSNVSHVLSGRNNPGYDFIKKIMEHYPDINPEWLILGNGQMYKEEKKSTTDSADQSQRDLFTSNNNPFIERKDDNKKTPSDENKDIMHASDNKTSNSSHYIERIVIFYKGNTFKEYKPESDDIQ